MPLCEHLQTLNSVISRHNTRCCVMRHVSPLQHINQNFLKYPPYFSLQNLITDLVRVLLNYFNFASQQSKYSKNERLQSMAGNTISLQISINHLIYVSFYDKNQEYPG